MLVKDLVVEDVESIDVKKDILDALFTMFSSRQKVLPVFDGKKLVGTVNISNYVKVLRGDFKDRPPESISVKEIMDDKLTIIQPTTEVSYVMDKICEKGFYALPVFSGHEFVGMITREDILKQFMNSLRGKFKVIDVMSYHTSTSSIHDPVENVAKKIISGSEKRIIVMNYDKIEGIITIKEVANILLAEKGELANMSVKDILTPNMPTVSKLDDAAKAAQMMIEWHTGAVPVVDKQLEGIVRNKDIIQRLRLIK